jgi:acyl carrier protein
MYQHPGQQTKSLLPAPTGREAERKEPHNQNSSLTTVLSTTYDFIARGANCRQLWRILLQGCNQVLIRGRGVIFNRVAACCACFLGWQSSSQAATPKAGIFPPSSDFNAGVACALFSAALLLCICNFLFLRRYKITREQLEKNRTFRILRDRKSIALFRFSPWKRILSEFGLKVVFPTLMYSCASAKGSTTTWAGFAMAAGILLLNTERVINWVFNHKTVFHRKHLLYRKEPNFMRLRLTFELVRRFAYFTLSFTLITYSINRIAPQCYSNTSGNVPLVVAHLQYNLSGMTALGSNSISAKNTFATSFEVFRTVFSFFVLVLFINVTISDFSAIAKRGEGFVMQLHQTQDYDSKTFSEKVPREDVKALIELYIEKNLGVRTTEIKEDSHLINDLGADSLEIVDLQVELEQAFETGEIPELQICDKRKVADLVNFFWDKLRNDTTPTQAGDIIRRARKKFK